MPLRVGHQHSQFWPILVRFLDYYSLFSVPIVISIVVEPKVPLRVGHQHSQFWPILARFLDYYSLFSVPIVITIVVEPQGAFTCRSSKLAVLAESGPYRGLLLIVLGSQSDFDGCQSARCDYLSVINTRCFGRFWPVSRTITHCFGFP